MTSTSASLLERLSAGTDPTAWGRFVDLYTPLMFRWCRGVGLDDADAADFVQDVFVILIEQFPQFRYDPTRSFRAWLKTVLMNAWRNRQRKLSRAPTGGGDPDLVPDTDPGHFVEEAEHRDYLVRRILTIAQADFEPLTWRACWEFVVNDRPATEVAAELGITVNVVYLAKSRVLCHLRTELAGFLDRSRPLPELFFFLTGSAHSGLLHVKISGRHGRSRDPQMHTLSDCPTAETLQQLLLGFGDAAFAAELERHVGVCPMCAERAKLIPDEDEVVQSVKRAKTTDDTPLPAIVQTLVTVLRRLHARSPGTATVAWSSKDAADAPTVTVVPPEGFLAPSAEPGEIGRFGPYAVHEVLGTGGMGVVYRGYDSRLRRAVAVKVIRPELLTAPGVTERFLAEARAAAVVEHDHIVVVHAVEIHDGVPSLIMPLLKGDTLERQLRDTNKPLPVREVLRIAHQVASGLAAAHAGGLIHRDIKPANLWVEQPSGRLKILDFGLAVVADAESSGGIAGTPGYMSPEQIRGEAVDARADLFSLGCVLYRAATGMLPFPGTSPSSVLVRTLSQEPLSIVSANPQLPPELVTLIEGLLVKDAAGRTESADAVLAQIAAINAEIAARHARRNRRRWLFGLAATGMASGLGMWLFGTPAPVVVPAPVAPPVRIEFVTDPEIGKVVFTRDGQEQVFDLRSDNVVSLVPGDYNLGSSAETAARKLDPDVINVLPDEPRIVKIALVGEVASTKAHDSAVTGVATVPGKNRFTVLSAGLDRRLQVWIPGTPNPESKLLTSPARCFATTTDGLLAVTAGGNKSEPFELGVQLWYAQTLQTDGEALEGHKRLIGTMAISPNGKHLITATRDEVFLWDVAKRTHLELEGHGKAKVVSAAFDATGKRALTGDEDGYLILWDVAGAKLIRKFTADPPTSVGAVRAVVFTPTGFVWTCDDGIIRIVDLPTFKVREVPVQAKPVLSLAVTKDGKRFLSGGEDGSVKLWSLVDGTLIHKFAGHSKAVRSVAVSPSGREAVTGGEDNAIRVWRLPFE